MRVLYTLQINDRDTLEYTFNGSVITATLNGATDVFDFTGMPDGKATVHGRNPEIVSTLPICPVIEAEVENGVLSVQLLKFISANMLAEEQAYGWIEVATDGGN
jgi:hypothetical protein